MLIDSKQQQQQNVWASVASRAIHVSMLSITSSPRICRKLSLPNILRSAAIKHVSDIESINARNSALKYHGHCMCRSLFVLFIFNIPKMWPPRSSMFRKIYYSSKVRMIRSGEKIIKWTQISKWILHNSHSPLLPTARNFCPLTIWYARLDNFIHAYKYEWGYRQIPMDILCIHFSNGFIAITLAYIFPRFSSVEAIFCNWKRHSIFFFLLFPMLFRAPALKHIVSEESAKSGVELIQENQELSVFRKWK